MAVKFFLSVDFYDYRFRRDRRFSDPYRVLGEFTAVNEGQIESFREQVEAEAVRRSVSMVGKDQIQCETVEALEQVEGRLQEFRVKAEQMAHKLAESSAAEIDRDDALHIAQYARDLAKQFGIQVPGLPSDEEDGPCDIYQWRHEGKVTTEAMQPKTWKLAKYLYEHFGNMVAMADLIGEDNLFEDSLTDDQSVAKQGRNATKWFSENGIPLAVSSSTKRGSETIWMKKVASE